MMMMMMTKAIALLLAITGSASAFTPMGRPSFAGGVCATTTGVHTTTLGANVNDNNDVAVSNGSRRDVLVQVGIAAGSLLLGGDAAHAERAAYLTEPTEEFKANEAKAMEFKRQQLLVKGKFTKVIERLTTVSKTEAELVADINELQDLVMRTGGLPLGIKKDELIKTIRRKKSAGFWPTSVEYA